MAIRPLQTTLDQRPLLSTQLVRLSKKTHAPLPQGDHSKLALITHLHSNLLLMLNSPLSLYTRTSSLHFPYLEIGVRSSLPSRNYR